MDFINVIIHSFDFESVMKLILGFVLAGIIGLERTSWNKPAGFRTHALVGISSVLVVLCGEYFTRLYSSSDPTRIPAQLLSGIGFVGAGTILRDGFNVKGLTTASSLLAVTCIGLCIGAGFYLGGIVATILTYLVLSYSYLLTDALDRFNTTDLSIKLSQNNKEILEKIETILNNQEVIIKKIDKSEISNKEKLLKITIKYNNRVVSLNSLFTSLTNLDNVLEVEES